MWRSEMVFRSMKNWNLRGKRIKTGQVAAAWTNDGKPLFSSQQVRRSDASRLRSIFDIM